MNIFISCWVYIYIYIHILSGPNKRCESFLFVRCFCPLQATNTKQTSMTNVNETDPAGGAQTQNKCVGEKRDKMFPWCSKWKTNAEGFWVSFPPRVSVPGLEIHKR